MIRKFILLLLCSFLFSNCDDGFIPIYEECYWTNDLLVLHKFLINSQLNISPLDLGVQQWENGRLVSFCSSIFSIHGCQEEYQLLGEIPSEIYFLDHLRDLRLLGNSLNGQIPTSIGQLTNLEYLDLSYNDLDGEIPTSIKNLTNLTDLYISNNNFSGSIPDELCNITNLRNFYAFSNSLIGELPSCIGELSELSVLSLFDNDFNGYIPNSIGQLSNLVFLDLSNNNIIELPQSISQMASLNYLHLNNNSITNIPEGICELNINWSFPTVSSIYDNFLCAQGYYPECMEEYLGDQLCDWFVLGDSDLNGVVNIVDVVKLVVIILYSDHINEFEFIVSDVETDFNLNILDVIYLVDIVLE